MFSVKCRKNCASKYRLILVLLLIGSEGGRDFSTNRRANSLFQSLGSSSGQAKRKESASANLGRASIDRVPKKECAKVVANLFDREFFVHWNATIIQIINFHQMSELYHAIEAITSDFR